MLFDSRARNDVKGKNQSVIGSERLGALTQWRNGEGWLFTLDERERKVRQPIPHSCGRRPDEWQPDHSFTSSVSRYQERERENESEHGLARVSLTALDV